MIVDELRALDRNQRSAFIASLLGWGLDAFDFFILTYVVKDIGDAFGAKVSDVAFAITLTLVARPVGALVFGWLADRFGRRPILMIDVGLYSLFALASAFSPNLITLLILRTLFGFAMGGEWGIGASLVMESVPPKSRGVISGILQGGYPMGYFLAALANLSLPYLGWRGMMMLGVIPALLILYVRRHVQESPVWAAGRVDAKPRTDVLQGLWRNWRFVVLVVLTTALDYLFNGTQIAPVAALVAQLPYLAPAILVVNIGAIVLGLLFGLPLEKRFLFLVVLMTAFNFFSHGSQDLYPTFLRVQHHMVGWMVTLLTMALNLGAIVGGLIFGGLSERIGRRRAIALGALLALPIIPVWAFSSTPLLLGLGAFLIQIAVQGAWGIIPVHLNEVSPGEVRGTFPGFAYQLGNLFASMNAVWQARIAEAHGDNYGMALAIVVAIVAVVIAVVVSLGPEARGVVFGKEAAAAPE